MMDPRARGAIEMTGAMTISGTIGWFVMKSGLPVASIVFWRCAIGALTLLIGGWAFGLVRTGPSWSVVGLAALGGVAFVLNWVFLFAAFPRASIAIATVVYNTQSFMLVLMGALLFRERPSRAAMGWLIIAFAGVLLIVTARSSAAHIDARYLTGILLALGAAFFYALAAIVAKKLAGTSPHLIVLIQLCVGCVMLAAFAREALPTTASQWALVATMGVVHTGVMCVLLYGAIQKLPTHLVGSLSFIYPVVAILVDLVAFGHRLSVVQITGAALILLAAAGATFGWSLRGIRPAVAEAERS
jgi:drug/metabolite transporter (DMT)-like permease